MFTRTKKWALVLALVILVLLSACGGAPNVDWALSINGEVNTPLEYSYDELAEMDMVILDNVLMEKSRGEDEVRSFSGVDLATLLDQAGAPEDFSTITATAADGYAIEISKDEMVDGIIAMKQSGEWIVDADPDAGPIRLVFPNTPANRWVFQITEITVNP
ncbi:MAG: molybdopterin-dependent oxidoreductase [Chloroflexota bacterium]|nr:molybdopterin-dependent oxidoreductase [Chloroflexota bacterium]